MVSCLSVVWRVVSWSMLFWRDGAEPSWKVGGVVSVDGGAEVLAKDGERVGSQVLVVGGDLCRGLGC